MNQEPRLSSKRQALLDQILKKKGVKTAKIGIPRRAGDRTTAPISFAQQRLWLLDQLEPNSSAYNMPAVVRLTGSLNVTALEQSLNEIVRRHEALRTTFVMTEGGVVQVIAPEQPLPLLVVDLGPLAESERETRAQELAAKEAQRPFDLATGPLLRATLLRLGSEDHIFLFIMHHIISDGWSIGVFIREVTALYQTCLAGQPPIPGRWSPLPELPIQYADFSAWQRGWLQGEMLENQLAYWKQQLNGAPPLLELPTDKPRPPALTFQGAHFTHTLPRTLLDDIQALSRKEGVTPFMTLLAAFQTLLYRYTGQTDLVIGTPIANRNHAEIESLIGFFVNTLALRADLSGNPIFRSLLQRTRETTQAAYMHQDMPFEMLIEALNVPRNLSHSPLFQVMFVLQNLPIEAIALPGLTLERLEFESGTTQFDLVLALTETEHGLVEDIEYSTDLFEPGTIQRLSQHFEVLLTALVADPEQRISDLPLLTENERQRMLVEWNNTQAEWPQDKCVSEIIAGQAQRAPDAIAVIAGDKQLTYQELNRQANRLARHLRALGVGPDVLVGMCLKRSPEAIVAILGILKAGGAYVPMDPGWPKNRLAFVLSDTNTPLLLTQHSLLDQLPENTPRVLCLDTDWMDAEDTDDENLPTTASLDHLAYIIYTSGSTGVPKGVLVSRRHLLHSITARIEYYPEPLTGYLLVSPFAFDSSVTGIFWPLCAGGVLALPPDNFHEELTCLADLIEKYRLSHFVWVPSLYHLLLTEAAPEKLSSLGCVIVAGETCTKTLVEQHFKCLPQAALYNEFGPTECSVWSTVYRCVPDEKYSQVPVGFPIGNVQAYVLDENMQPAPIGVVGEVYFGGNGITYGYLNQPALTAEKYIPNPFVTVDGGPPAFDRGWTVENNRPPSTVYGRLYRTGDLARYLPDGNLDFMGRCDHQVKLHGFRIELEEIEAALGQHPQVRESVVVIPEQLERIVAYIVPHDEQKPAGDEMRRFLQERLPMYMLPSVFVVLTDLPRTPTGKIDRRALPEPENTPDTRTYQSPRNALEQTLAEIWSAALGIERIGVHDNFFALGGDSIISIQVASRARRAGIHITPKQLFQHQTIAELAEAGSASAPIQAEQGRVLGPVPLTPIQHWFFEQAFSEPQHFNQAVMLKTARPLAPDLLQGALRALLAHHDGLRMRYNQTASGWQQTNADLDDEIPFTYIDLSHLSPSAQQLEIERQAAELQASLDLTGGPLLRLAYWRLGAEDTGRLLIAIHHLVVDGVSWRILLEDFENLCIQISRAENVCLPFKTTSFKQWAEQFVIYAQSETVQQELSKWLDQPWRAAQRLPVDHPQGCNTVASEQTHFTALNPSETHTLLQEIPPVYHTQINDVLLAALAQAFKQWTGAHTLLLDLEGHGRQEVIEGIDLSRTVGWFTSVFPVCLNIEDAQTPRQALIGVKEQLRCIPENGINYAVLKYLNENGSKTLQNLPKAELIFNYLGQLDQTLSGTILQPAEESVGPCRSTRELRSYLIEINSSISAGRLQLAWTYSPNCHRSSTIEQFAAQYMQALREIIAHCQAAQTSENTAADFPAARLNQSELERLFGAME